MAAVASLDGGEAAAPAAKVAVSTKGFKQDVGEEVQQQEQAVLGSGPSGGFDWGGSCSSGQGSFDQVIEKGAVVEVGEIPAGKEKVWVDLKSAADVDLHVYEKETGVWLVGWPSGQINAHDKQTLNEVGDMSIVWSGYLGINGNAGHESLNISTSSSALVLKAFGYRAGTAKVNYGFESTACKKSFKAEVGKGVVMTLGSIPAGLKGVKVKLQSDVDIDIQLAIASTGKKIVCWNKKSCIEDGLSSDKKQSKIVELPGGKDQSLTYSGYNGDKAVGDEYLYFNSDTAVQYDLQVLGYKNGVAKVTYEFEQSPKNKEKEANKPGAPPTHITAVDLRIEDNRVNKARNTFLYRTSSKQYQKLVVRRGSYAEFAVDTSAELKPGEQFAAKLHLEHQQHKPHTQEVPLITDSEKPCGTHNLDKWHVCITSTEEDDDVHRTILRLNVPVTAPFAMWKLCVCIKGEKHLMFPVENHLIATVFNPYHQEDPVFMPDVALRAEYVENENGAIWVGTKNKNNGKPWAYNHFNLKVLTAAYDILTRPNSNGFVISIERMADPVSVSRALTYAVAGHMLQGRWSEPYCNTPDGELCDNTKPWAWTGSIKIVETYLMTKQPVKYGQCFVFSGLLTSLGRAIGIPTRSVSNFESAHDHKPFDHFVSKYWTYTAHKTWVADSYLNRDSVWNFHVWNDMWMKRPDLTQVGSCKKAGAKNFDGWQAVDATYQERSMDKNLMNDKDPNHYYQCGPVPLKALQHQCEEGVPFDWKFIYGEVEATKEELTRNMNDPHLPETCKGDRAPKTCFKRKGFGYTKNEQAVGFFLSTSLPGTNPRKVDIITSQYKKSEDPKEELMESLDGTLTQEVSLGKRGALAVTYPGKGIHAGEDLKIAIAPKPGQNGTYEDITIVWRAHIVHYTGADIEKHKGEIKMGTGNLGKDGTFKISVNSMMYATKLRHGVTIAVDAVLQAGDDFLGRVSDLRVPVHVPHVHMAIVGESVIHRCVVDASEETVGFKATVTNPFWADDLTHSTLTIEVAGMDRTPEIDNPDWTWAVPGLGGKQSWHRTKKNIPVAELSCGSHEIMSTWNMDEIAESTDATGAVAFVIDCSRCAGDMTPKSMSDIRRLDHATAPQTKPLYHPEAAMDQFASAEDPFGEETHKLTAEMVAAAQDTSTMHDGIKYEHLTARGLAMPSRGQLLANGLPPDVKSPVETMSHVQVLAHANRMLKALSDYVEMHPVEAAVSGAYKTKGPFEVDKHSIDATKDGFPMTSEEGVLRKERDDDAGVSEEEATDTNTTSTEDAHNDEASKEFAALPEGDSDTNETKAVEPPKIEEEKSDKDASNSTDAKNEDNAAADSKAEFQDKKLAAVMRTPDPNAEVTSKELKNTETEEKAQNAMPKESLEGPPVVPNRR